MTNQNNAVITNFQNRLFIDANKVSSLINSLKTDNSIKFYCLTKASNYQSFSKRALTDELKLLKYLESNQSFLLKRKKDNELIELTQTDLLELLN